MASSKIRSPGNALSVISGFESELNSLIGDIKPFDDIKAADRKISIAIENNIITLSQAVNEDLSANLFEKQVAQNIKALLDEINAKSSRFYSPEPEQTLAPRLEEEKIRWMQHLRSLRTGLKRTKSGRAKQKIAKEIKESEGIIEDLEVTKNLVEDDRPEKTKKTAEKKKRSRKSTALKRLWEWAEKHPDNIRKFVNDLLIFSRKKRISESQEHIDFPLGHGLLEDSSAGEESSSKIIQKLDTEKRIWERLRKFLSGKAKTRKNEKLKERIMRLLNEIGEITKDIDLSKRLLRERDAEEIREVAEEKESKEKLEIFRHLWSWLKRRPTQVKRFALDVLKSARLRRWAIYGMVVYSFGFSLKEVGGYFYDAPLQPPPYASSQVYPQASGISEVGPSLLLKKLMAGEIVDPTLENSEEDICARYTTLAINSIFGSRIEGWPSAELMGTFGSAWEYRDNILKKGGKLVWRGNDYGMGGEEFTDYYSLKTGDILGIHFTGSRWNNKSTTGYTHIGLVAGNRISKFIFTSVLKDDFLTQFCERYGIEKNKPEKIRTFRVELNGITYNLDVVNGVLGYKGWIGFTPFDTGDTIEVNEVIILHYWHSPSDKYVIMDPNDHASRLESMQHFFSEYGHRFKIKEVVRPKEGLVKAYMEKPEYVRYRAVPYKVAAEDLQQSDQIVHIIAKHLAKFNVIPIESDIGFLKNAFFDLNTHFYPNIRDRPLVQGALVYVPTSIPMNNRQLSLEMGFLEQAYRFVKEKIQQAWELAGGESETDEYFTQEGASLNSIQHDAFQYAKMKIYNERGNLKRFHNVNLTDGDVNKWAHAIAEAANTNDMLYLDLFIEKIREECLFQMDYPKIWGREGLSNFWLGRIASKFSFFVEHVLFRGKISFQGDKIILMDSVVPSWRNPTIGPMQVNLLKGQALLEKHFGKRFSLSETKSILKSLRGGILVGRLVLDEIILYYGGLTTDNKKLVRADYVLGIGSCRDAAIQKMLNDVGYKIDNIDGILAGEAKKALTKFVEDNGLGISNSDIDEFVGLARTKSLEKTGLYNALKESYKLKTGEEPPYAIIPTGTREIKTPLGTKTMRLKKFA